MHQGFIKVAAATPRIRVADVDFNAGAIIDSLKTAAQAGARLCVLPELVLTGYTCGDLFLQDTLLSSARRALEAIVDATANLDMVSLIGLPLDVNGRVYNCAAATYRGHVLAFIPKTNLPNYGEFYEKRQFTPAPEGRVWVEFGGGMAPLGTDIVLRCADMPDFSIGVELCEDLWVPDTPSVRLARMGATIICNLSASDETIGKADYRRLLVESKSGSLVSGYVYADAGDGVLTGVDNNLAHIGLVSGLDAGHDVGSLGLGQQGVQLAQAHAQQVGHLLLLHLGLELQELEGALEVLHAGGAGLSLATHHGATGAQQAGGAVGLIKQLVVGVVILDLGGLLDNLGGLVLDDGLGLVLVLGGNLLAGGLLHCLDSGLNGLDGLYVLVHGLYSLVDLRHVSSCASARVGRPSHCVQKYVAPARHAGCDWPRRVYPGCSHTLL